MRTNSSRPTSAPLGFTLVELLVVIAIIAMFMTALFPAVQAMRSSARRAQCRNQLLELFMAVQSHEMAHEHLPAGVRDDSDGPIRSVAQGQHQGWILFLLPYLDEGNVYRRVNFDASVYHPSNEEVRTYTLPQLICPADVRDSTQAYSSYAACHHGVEAPIDDDNQGVFYLNSKIMTDDVRDGLSQTIFLGEKLLDDDGLGWMSGTRATLRNTGQPINQQRGPGFLVRDSDDPVDEVGAQFFGGNGGDDEEDSNDMQEEQGDGDNNVVSPAAESNHGEQAAAESATELEDASPAAVAKPNELFVGGFGSSHPGGAHVVFGDGRIQFMTQQIDRRVYHLLGNRDDGNLLRVEEYRE